MGSWRIVDLDAPSPEPPPPRGRRAGRVALTVALVVAAFAVVTAASQLAAPSPTSVGPEFAPRPSAAPTAMTTTAFALHADPRDAQPCGSFSAASPSSTFAGAALAIRRIDADVVLAADPDWAWCLAGVRIFDEGLELVGTLGVRGRQTTGGARPLLRDASFTADVPGFGALDAGELLDVNGYAVLRMRAVGDVDRARFATAAGAASALKLRVAAIAGPWSFDAVPLVEGPLDATAQAHGITFQLHDLKLLTDAVATTLYALSDTPDPAIISFEWDAIDDAGTIYRQLPDRRVAGTLPGFYRAFAPAPPPAARRIAFAIRRIHLSSLDVFATDLALR